MSWTSYGIQTTRHTRAIGLATGLDTAALFVTASTLFIPIKSMANRSKNPWTLKQFFQKQLEESIHHFGTTKDHAERQYWQGYGSAMKASLEFFNERMDHDNAFN